MAGLSDINRREQKRAEGRVSNAARKEIWLRDGDQVFLRSVATGEDGDAMLEELYVFALQTDSGSWQRQTGLWVTLKYPKIEGLRTSSLSGHT